MKIPPPARPELTLGLSEQEFSRWYWLKAELQAFARAQGLGASGGKELLEQRIGARLGGRPFREPVPVRRRSGTQLSDPLSPDTIIPVGQRSSQVVRAWMREQIGPQFHFDAEMREFFAQSDGTKTLLDAVDHFRATRNRASATPDRQFEFNRFTRAWHQEHPGGSSDELREAWRQYRDTPLDERGRA